MRVLGLDISKDGVACVEVESAFGRYEIRETHEISIPENNSEDPNENPTPPVIAAQLLASLPQAPDRLVTALPVEFTTFRNLPVATRDKKAIHAALEFELEDDLPFEKDDLHYDYAILDTGAQGAMIHIGASKKDRIAGYLQGLLAEHIEPEVVTTDAWAYRCLLTRVKGLPETIMIVGFEQSKTFFYVHSKNKPVLYREISFGVHTIERKLKSTLNGNESELKTWIEDIGVSGIDEQVSKTISDSLDLMLPELKQTELASRNQIKGAIDQVYVTGSGALMPGFLNWLEDAIGRPVALFKPLSMVSPAQVSYSDTTEIRFSRALALAFVTIPADKIQPLNFRKGIFAKINANNNSPIELIKKPLPYLLITLFVFFIVKTVEYKYFSSKLTDTEESLKRSVKNYYSSTGSSGTISDGAVRSYISNISGLKKKIDGDLAKERELAKLYSPNPNSPFEFLKSMSQKIGKDIVLDMVSFDVGSDYTDKFVDNKSINGTVTFIISNPQLLAKLTEVMEKNFSFRKGASEEVSFDGHKAYQVSFSGTIGTKK
jgi:Tfp pilus assembly PilM family ATPase